MKISVIHVGTHIDEIVELNYENKSLSVYIRRYLCMYVCMYVPMYVDEIVGRIE
jgi:hypothetical protein